MKSLRGISLCILMLLQSFVLPAQQSNDAVAAINDQVQWISKMVAMKKMSAADANARLNELIIQIGKLASSTPPAPAGPSVLAAPSTPGSSKAASQPTDFPADAQLPTQCSLNPVIQIAFNPLTTPNDETLPNPPLSTIPLGKMTRLNPNESGGEVYTKRSVYVAYVNILRYGASLGGVVSVIAAPSIPFSSMFTTTPLTPSPAPKTTTANVTASVVPTAQQKADFHKFSDCYNAIQDGFLRFQSNLKTEENYLNRQKQQVTDILNNIQPFADSVESARNIAKQNYSQLFPTSIPPFPTQDLGNFKILVNNFLTEYEKIAAWAKAQGGATLTEYQQVDGGAQAISTRLDQYLGFTSNTTGADDTSNANDPSNAKNTNSGSTRNSKAKKGKDADGTSTPPSTPASTATSEADDYASTANFLTHWKAQFKYVATVSPDEFVVTYQPACGGFFGNGTSTQMQLSIADSLNPPAAGAKVTPITLDSVVCQPTISVSNGLGLSFIPSQTPAFVPDTVPAVSGNPTIIQSLGYSSQSKVSAGYALQTNASLWQSPDWEYEAHWSIGAMLTASTSGATTDIVTGPSISFKRRAFFVSPMYDLGLRTKYVPPFQPGTPQGSLTSPPTHQVWESGFALTLTFPFNTGTKNTVSSDNGATTVTNNTGNNAGGSTPAKKTPSEPNK